MGRGRGRWVARLSAARSENYFLQAIANGVSLLCSESIQLKVLSSVMIINNAVEIGRRMSTPRSIVSIVESTTSRWA